MRALILAAGRGSRMRTMTAHRPKCLVEIGGKPLLEWQISALREGGVNQIAVVRGYMAESLRGPGYVTFDNPRWAETNMVGTLLCADQWLQEEECVVSYADIVYHPDAVRAIAGASADIGLTYDRLWKQLWTERFEDPLADAETFRCGADGRLIEIGRRASSLREIEGQYMGLLKFTPKGWTLVRDFLQQLTTQERDKLDMTSLLSRLLTDGIDIQAVPIEGRWCEVDSEEDLEIYQERLSEVMPWRHDWRWEEAA